MLFLSGYDLTLEDLTKFRQLGSRTPGHPESSDLKGVEVTTGPLGQGFANGVGMGVAERLLRAEYGPDLVDHHTFVFCSDGDLMEGISHEAASLAGHLGLGRLIYVYDDNHITIDGPTEIALGDDAVKRFDAYGWHTEDLGEIANDTVALEAAVRRAMAVEDRPSFLQLRSHIGWPAPHMTDTPQGPRRPVPPGGNSATKTILGLPPDKSFWVPDDVLAFYRAAGARGAAARDAWAQRLEARLPDRQPRAPALGRGMAGPGPGRLRAEAPDLEGGRQARHPGGPQDLPQRRGPRRPRARLGRRRPDRQHRHHARRLPLQSKEHPEGPHDGLRGTRARHGRARWSACPATAGYCR